MIIDAHAHGMHSAYIDKLIATGGSWANKSITSFFSRIGPKPHTTDVKLRVEMLQRHGIDLQVVTQVSSMECNSMPGDAAMRLAYARLTNDGMAKFMEDSKGKLICGGSVPLEGFEAGGRQEMERAINKLGLKVISIPTNVRGKPVDAAEFEPFWAQAAQMDVAVYLHPVGPAGNADRSYEVGYDLIKYLGWPFETELMLSRLVFSGIMERYPALKVVSHHLGGGIPFFFPRMDEMYEPALIETPGSLENKLFGRVLPRPLFDYFSRFYYDTAIGDCAPAIRCTYDVFGADRLLFATDAPFGPGPAEAKLTGYQKVVTSLGLPEAVNRKIFADNARRVLKLA